ncbi:MAG: HD domain-containing protein [Pseudomonadota bacterium]
MNEIYLKLRDRARQIVDSLPIPVFRQELVLALSESEFLLASDPLLKSLAGQMSADLDNDFGHGILHATLVCIDAGAIVHTEMQDKISGKTPGATIREQMVLAQAAGLLHDIRRKQANHAEKGAAYAADLLERQALKQSNIETICRAIREHEAFVPADPDQGAKPRSLISDALYDADKFRWGTDNFTHTLWDMVMFARIPLQDFIQKYPGGMHKLSQIRDTFRTNTGKKYGPEMIDLGIETGNRLFDFLKTEYPSFF